MISLSTPGLATSAALPRRVRRMIDPPPVAGALARGARAGDRNSRLIAAATRCAPAVTSIVRSTPSQTTSVPPAAMPTICAETATM